MPYNIGYTYTPGAKAGSAQPAVRKITTCTVDTIDEAWVALRITQAAIQPMELMAIVTRPELGYLYVSAFGLWVDPVPAAPTA